MRRLRQQPRRRGGLSEEEYRQTLAAFVVPPECEGEDMSGDKVGEHHDDARCGEKDELMPGTG